AVAHLRSADVAATSATLTATTPSNVQTRTYTCDNQTFEVTTGRWSGTATSTTADLNGAAVVNAKSVYNVTKKLGWVDGSIKISGADDRAHLGFTAVNTDGKLDGWVRGHAGRGDGSAIGSGTGTNAALIVKGLRCNSEQTPKPSVHLFVRGQVEAVSATSITVKPKDGTASQTCTVKD